MILWNTLKDQTFPGGGFIYDKSVIRQAYTTGRGSIIMRAKAEITEERENRALLCTRFPIW